MKKRGKTRRRGKKKKGFEDFPPALLLRRRAFSLAADPILPTRVQSLLAQLLPPQVPSLKPSLLLTLRTHRPSPFLPRSNTLAAPSFEGHTCLAKKPGTRVFFFAVLRRRGSDIIMCLLPLPLLLFGPANGPCVSSFMRDGSGARGSKGTD